MKEEWKVYIKGVQGRGEEVKQALINLGGYVVRNYNYTVSDCLYYINHNEEIRCTEKTTEIGKIIMDNYTELHLPEKWKDGDVLVSDKGFVFVLRGDFELGVKKECADAYCCVSEHQICLSGHFGQIGLPHLASPQEVEHFHELMHKYGKDWDAEKKQVINWKWKPKIGESYFFIDSLGDIHKGMISSYGNKKLFDSDNYFQTKEEAEAMTKKIKKLLKENHEKTKENS